MNLPKQLQDVMEERARAYQADDTRTKLGPANSYIRGAEALYEHLLESTPKFDHFASAAEFTKQKDALTGSHAGPPADWDLLCWNQSGLWQHSQSSARIEALKLEVEKSQAMLNLAEIRLKRTVDAAYWALLELSAGMGIPEKKRHAYIEEQMSNVRFCAENNVVGGETLKQATESGTNE